MAQKRRKFGRKLGEDSYKRRFVIATEGRKTETQYFKILNWLSPHLVTLLPPNDKSSPCKVLEQMKRHLSKKKLEFSDEAWLVVDKDRNSKNALGPLDLWAQGNKRYNFALSNPEFEYWLLLHFDDGNSIGSLQECRTRLRRYLPNYDKTINKNQFPRDKIEDAIRRALQREQSLGPDRLNAFGNTTVYKLVEKLLKDE